MTERAPALVLPRAEVFAATVRELARAPRGWEEEAERGPADETAGATPQSQAERGLAHVFTLLSLAVEREPLQIAHRAVLGQDPGLRGTALEYLENVLPDDVRRALWPHLGAGLRAAAAPRPRQNLVQDLLRSGATLGMNRADLKREPPD
jgi:ATP:ADP antiporter, AAA family